MRISQAGPNRQASAPRRARSSGVDGSAFANHLPGAASSDTPQEVAHASETSGIGSLLSVQEVPDATANAGRRRTTEYGEDLLDRLDTLRLELLLGSVSADRLANMARTLRARQQRSGDPRLEEIIDEIELRTQVEIAKLR